MIKINNFTKVRSSEMRNVSDAFIVLDCDLKPGTVDLENFISLHIFEGEKSMKLSFDKEIALKLRKELDNAILKYDAKNA